MELVQFIQLLVHTYIAIKLNIYIDYRPCIAVQRVTWYRPLCSQIWCKRFKDKNKTL